MANLEKAKEMYELIKRAFAELEWTYDEREEDMMIISGTSSNDLPIRFGLDVLAENEVIRFLSPMPTNVPDDKRVDAAIAVAVANYGMIHGSFDYDMRDGEIRFRMTTSYRDSQISTDVIKYMMIVGARTMDDYNDRFFALSTGNMTLEEFIAKDGQ